MSKHENATSSDPVEAKTQKKMATKLRLDKVVIRSLTDPELGYAAGAMSWGEDCFSRNPNCVTK